jgi:bifunctional DNase/RNase
VRQLEVIGVRVEMPSNTPIVLLRDSESGKYLPIWIGAGEASAISLAQQGVVPPRPLTHDLLADVITTLGASVAEVRITELRDGVFYACVSFADGREVSARPSDAIALALRTGAGIVGAPEVLEAAGIELPDEEQEGVEDDQVERFREFLDQVSPEDFG